VLNIKQGSPAADTELQPGDIIVAVNRHPVRTVEDMRKFAGPKSGSLLLQVRRGNAMFIYPLQAPNP
jgi:serine protease Do/serine protease DegQ